MRKDKMYYKHVADAAAIVNQVRVIIHSPVEKEPSHVYKCVITNSARAPRLPEPPVTLKVWHPRQKGYFEA
jgi:hypothetical protein